MRIFTGISRLREWTGRRSPRGDTQAARHGVASASFLAGAMLAAGCASGPVPGEPVAVTLEPAGVTVQVETKDHALLTLSVPPGAVSEPVDVLIVPAEPEGDEAARFVFTPSGVSFAQPVSATVELRRPVDGSVPLGIAWDDQGVPTRVLSDGDTQRVEASLLDLGYPPAVSDAQLHLVVDPSSLFVIFPFGCDMTEAHTALEAAYLANSPAQIRRAWVTYYGVLDACEKANADAAIAAIEKEACDRYDAALLVAQTTAAEDFAGFLSVASPLIAAAGEVQIAGATCDISAYPTVVADKMTQAITFFGARLSPENLSADLEPELDMLDTLIAFDTNCQQLQVDVCAPLREVLYPRVLDMIRTAAWKSCQTTGKATLSGTLYADGLKSSRPVAGRLPPRGREEPYFDGYAAYTYGDLEEDVTYCASRLDITLFDGDTPPSEVTPGPAPLAAGALPGSGENEATFDVDPKGSLTLSGSVTTLPCAPGITTNDELVARVGPTEVGRVPARNGVFTLGTRPLLLEVPTLLTAAGADATTVDLRIVREGNACGIYSSPFDVYLLHLKLPEADTEEPEVPPSTIVVSPELSVVQPGDSILLTATTVPPGSPVTWFADGGTIDAQGLFTAGDTPMVALVQATNTTDGTHTVVHVGIVRSGTYASTQSTAVTTTGTDTQGNLWAWTLDIPLPGAQPPSFTLRRAERFDAPTTPAFELVVPVTSFGGDRELRLGTSPPYDYFNIGLSTTGDLRMDVRGTGLPPGMDFSGNLFDTVGWLDVLFSPR